jgi:signal transduction histidine kinase
MALLNGPDHRFAFQNSAFLAMGGRDSSDEILGKTVQQAFPELEGQSFNKILDHVYQTGEPFAAKEYKLRLVRQGKQEIIYASFSCHPMRSVEGGVEGVLIHAVDETGQVLARTQLEARVEERTAELTEAEQRLRVLSNRLMRAQDDERRRVARELHDSAGQTLAALKMQLVPLEQGVTKHSSELGKLASNGIDLVDDLSKELRTMSYLLHPPLLDEAGLPSALRWYVEGFSERSGIQVTLAVDPELPSLPEEVETTIFRIVQEYMTNIHRNSGSKSASLRILHNATDTRVEIQDKGRGIEQNGAPKRTAMRLGVGIQGMQERVRQLHGQLDIQSGKAGTTVVVLLPHQLGSADVTGQAEVA